MINIYYSFTVSHKQLECIVLISDFDHKSEISIIHSHCLPFARFFPIVFGIYKISFLVDSSGST